MKILTKVFSVLLLILTFSHFFSQEKYDLQWKKISENYKSGQYKSSLPIILEIQKEAMKDNNAVQLIHSLKAEFSILNQTHDDIKNNEASLFFEKLKTIEPSLSGDGKLIFQVLLGEFFQDYYSEHSWEIRERTNVDNQDFSQIETWSRLGFKNYLSQYFKDRNAQKSLLEKVEIKPYQKIFQDTENLNYYPTLADWNSINEINFLKNADFFTKNEIKDNHEEILKIYNALIANNSGNAKLQFQFLKLNYECDFSACKNQLEQLENLYNSPENGDFKVLIAESIIQKYMEKQEFKTALNWIDKVNLTFPNSLFINNIEALKNQITQPSLNIKYDKKTLADKPIQLLANAKNLDQFSLNIYKVNGDFQNYLNYTQRSYEQNLFQQIKKTLVRKEQFNLPKFDDYKNHSTALEIKPLPSGIYMVEYVVNGEITQRFSFIATNSRIIYADKSQSSGKILKLVDRNTGENLTNRKLELYEFTNNGNLTKSDLNTDTAGNFKFPKSTSNDYYRTYLVNDPKTNDVDLISVYGNRNYVNPKNEDQEMAQIFLDRAIYRPGQTVYYKVIATAYSGETNQEIVVKKVKLNIVLNDANYKEIATQTLTTNDFGSVNGSFTLPKGKLNGRFSIEVDNDDDEMTDYIIEGDKNFQVEEYKRPKFEVNFEPIKGEYKYGETVEVKGKAMMFSGVALSNVTVNYEIKKQNIRWRYFWWYPRGNDNENSILGEVKTNEKGEFSIKLDLKKDEKLEGIQIDNFEIKASVTDINGETQSATENFKVASVSHYIDLADIPNSFADENIKVKVATKNYNDQNLDKSYHVKLSKIEPENRVIRSNFKNAIQDAPVFSKEEFIKKFPHDYYDKSELKDKVETVISEKIQEPGIKNQNNGAKNHNSEILNLGSLKAGKYKLELYNIEGSDTIKAEKTFEVFSQKFLAKNQKPFLEVLKPTKELDRNEKAEIYIYSAIPNAVVNIFVQDGKSPQKMEQKTLKNGVLKYEISLPKDESINSLNVQVQLVAFNDVKTENFNLIIKSDKKPLRIETTTFRDKLEPGAKEKWTLKILGDGKDAVNAEVLANMYDQSLDQFAVNSYDWQSLKRDYSSFNYYTENQYLKNRSYSKRLPYLKRNYIVMPQFQWFDGGLIYSSALYESEGNASDTLVGKVAGVSVQREMPAPVAKNMAVDSAKTQNIEEVVQVGYGKKVVKAPAENLDNIPVRQNLNETAFFYPQLRTDKDGNISFEFTSPEALTQWKVMFLAHTKNAESAYLEKSVITQKEFSVTPNYPRFLREGDEMILQTKLSSLVDKPLSGVAQLQILDAFTNEDISNQFNLNETQKPFSLKENGNGVINWTLKVPNNVSSIILKVVAKSSPLNPLKGTLGTLNTSYSDGEQKAIAILPNRMLVTDAVPIFVKQGETKTFVLDALKNNTSKTAQNVSNTLELTTNPIWEIMFALPSLKNDSNLSADVVFNKWFADVLASEIFKANPKLKTVFEEYQSKGLLKSNLEKNQELKQLLLEETPWVLDAKNETEQMEKLARLFDANTMRNSINDDWTDLQKLQNPDGGFSWYSGYPSSYYSSLYILKNLGKINVWLKGNLQDYQSSEQKEMVKKLITYVDGEMARYYDIREAKPWSNANLDYLDARHYWEKYFPLSGKGLALKKLVIEKAKTADIKDFTFFGLHRSALLFNEYGLKSLSDKLLTYLKETSTQSETQGVYWKQNFSDWGWFSSKVVNEAGALDAFNQLKPEDQKFIEEMKIWLITQKKVNSWETSRGTAEVIFTILNSGQSWTSSDSDKSTIVWGGKELKNPDTKATGYVKSTVKSDVLNKKLGTVTITKPGAGIVQGGLFWQYYEDLDKIKSSENYISITKELYKKVKTVNGEELQKTNENSPLKIGDRVTVRMILNTDRPMEFIHLKDMRAAGFEPVNVISGYRWKNNLGYYQSTKDASTNFYIEQMPKGKYVFEYDYICNAAGTFSNGITTLQNYYAPEMNARTQGTKVEILEK